MPTGQSQSGQADLHRRSGDVAARHGVAHSGIDGTCLAYEGDAGEQRAAQCLRRLEDPQGDRGACELF